MLLRSNTSKRRERLYKSKPENKLNKSDFTPEQVTTSHTLPWGTGTRVQIGFLAWQHAKPDSASAKAPAWSVVGGFPSQQQ